MFYDCKSSVQTHVTASGDRLRALSGESQIGDGDE